MGSPDSVPGAAGRPPRRLFRKTTLGLYGLAATVGMIAGGAGVLFEYMGQGVAWLALGLGCGFDPDGPAGEARLVPHVNDTIKIIGLLTVPTIGGLLAGWICHRFAPEAKGHGTDTAIDAFHHHDGFIRTRVPGIKMLATAISLGTGGSGGREGPIALAGAGFGSFLGRLLQLTARQRRILLAAGVGAGVGCIFRAPLAGALFSAEILYRDAEFESDVVLPSFISCAVAYCVTCGFFGEFGPLFVLQSDFVFTDPREILGYSLLAVILVPMVWLYVRVFYGTEHLFDRIPMPRPLVAALGGFLTGAIGLGLWKFSGDDETLGVLAYGYGVLQSALDGNFVTWAGAGILVLIALGKIVTTSLTISSGGSGGVFGPSMVIGGAIGGAVGIVCWKLGIVENPACFVIVGMCGFFAGAANTPVSTIVMVSEMTGSYRLILPAMWVCAIVFLSSRRWTIYAKQVANRASSPAHRGKFLIPLLQGLTVRDIFQPRPTTTVSAGTSLADVLKTVAETHADYFPVLDDEGRFVGIFSAHDVRAQTYDSTLHDLAIAADLMITNPIVLRLGDDLHSALERFHLKNIDVLPVVDEDDDGRLLGLLERREITRAYDARLVELRRLQDEEDGG